MAVLDFQSIFDSSFTQIILSICILAYETFDIFGGSGVVPWQGKPKIDRQTEVYLNNMG